MTIESVEPGLLVEDMFEKKIDAWMIGWYVAIPLDLKFLWYSDFETATYNFAGYQNKEADKILDKISRETNTSRINDLYKQFQKIIYEDTPVTFLYWIDNIIVYNKRLDNLDINPLGVVHHCWEWTVRR